MVSLTVQQTKIAILVGRGFPLQKVANKLGVHLSTVKEHLGKARKLTGARNAAHLAVMVALARGKK